MFRTGSVPGSITVTVTAAPPLKVRLLGPSEIALGDRVLGRNAWKGRKARTLLLILCHSGSYQIHREQLLELLWPDLDLEAGNNALYKTLHSLRRTLEPSIERGRDSRYVETRGETVGLAPGATVWTDVEQFHTLVSQAKAQDPASGRMLLRRALDLHRGLYLADEPYADWPVTRRETLRTHREQAALTLATLDHAAGDPLVTVPYLEALLATDPTVEPIHRSLMQAYAAGGQRELALRQFERCRDTLDRALGDHPEPATIRLVQSIRDQTARESTDPAPIATNRGFLPALPSRTVGRKDEIERLSNLLLQPETRLVTVVGPGGVGKTRLATDVAHRLRQHFPDGANLVALVAITHANLLFDAIATAFRLHDDPTRSKQDLVIDHLQSRSMLLVLDNLEQLEDAATGIADLVEACPDVTIVATSRIPLRLRAERLLRLHPLALPNPDVEPQARQGATDLFWQLLEALDASSLSPADRHSVADLCIQLDGLPLAIELAAARCSEHSPAAVLAQLQEHSRLALLRDGPRDLPDRQQTLEDVVRWSYDLLPTAEQALFRQLALFPGGIEADALEMLAGEDAEALATALAEASLVQWSVVDGVRRLTMLQTIREVAHLLLERAGELPSLRERQGIFYREFAATAAKGYEGVNQLDILTRFRREVDTLRGVLDWSATAVAPANLGLEIMTDTAWLWKNLGLTLEGFGRLKQALKVATPTPALHHVRGTATLGTLAYRLAEFDEARAWADRSRDLAKELKLPAGILQAGRLDSLLLQQKSAWDACIELNQNLLALARRTQSPLALMDCLVALGIALHYKGDLTSASAYLDEALSVAHRHTNHLYASLILSNQTEIAYALGDFSTMRNLLAQTEQVATLVSDLETLAWSAYLQVPLHDEAGDYRAAAIAALRASNLFAKIGSQRMVGGTRVTHALNLVKAEAYPEAIAAFRTTLDLVTTTGHSHDIVSCVEEVGFLAIKIGRPADGLTLLAAFRSEMDRLGEGISDYDDSRLQDHWKEACVHLTVVQAEEAEAAGRVLSIDDAVQLARQVCTCSEVSE